MKTVSGLFDDYADAQSAVRELEQAGIPPENIGIIANNAGGRYSPESGAAEGAGAGAAIGATSGGGVGLLTGLGLMAVPGIGPIVAAGWLAATAAGAATGAIAGGAVGGVIGALSESGIDEADANVYAEGIRRGGALVTARSLSEPLAEHARTIFRNRGVDLAERRAAYEATGWRRFDERGEPLTETEIGMHRDRLRSGL
ncbi:hypothetical protein MZK49_21940 [Ensifer sesbaniae]|uniref:hypothetical protein n=1 Tax=Ensifer sesbaniae TaxID=1214071 RepID=UPI0020019295|nr:hypothetical protein [Ensifer sesbaniae]